MAFSYSEQEWALMEEALRQLEFSLVLEKIEKYCISEHGKEITGALKPSEDTEHIRKEHNKIAELIRIATEDDTIPLENLPDVRLTLNKTFVRNSVLNTTEILNIADAIRVGRLIKGYFAGRGEKYPEMTAEISEIHENRILEKHIDAAISETGEVRDNASRELSRIRKEIHEKSNRLRSRVEKILKQVSEDDMTQDDFVSIREGRYVLPIKVENKRQIPGIIHGVSQTGATVFLEPSEIIEMNNELSLLLNEEKREIYRILSNLTEEIGTEADLFLHSVAVVAHLDSLKARAEYALEYGGVKPEISDSNELYLKDIRHPLLVHNKGNKNVVPLRVEFSSDKRGHLISGPNAGGKTVALKSIGLNVAMALSGIYPLGVCNTDFRMIFSSIGDHQSITNDLSTFSSQILQLKEIVANSDPNSLVLIDEIGTGTDPQEGSALSAGILDTLLELKSFFVVTTHHSTLKSYALTRNEIENDSLEFNEKELKPTYKFLTGVPGNSYAFVLAKNLGIQKQVLERADKYLGTRQSQVEDSISALQKLKTEAEELKLQSESEKIKAEKLRKDYEQRYNEIKNKKQDIISEARKEAYDIIQRANSLVESTIREIKEEKRSINEIRNEYNKEKKDIESKLEEIKSKGREKTDPSDFKVSDNIIVDGNESSVGVILEIDTIAKNALIDFNGIKFRFGLDRLSKTITKPKASTKSNVDYIAFDAKSSIDIRGMRVGEIMRELEEFISKGILANIGQLTIIHGKGTGALRKAVKEYLETHYAIKSYRPGKIEEGGDGVTIIEF